MNNDFMWDDSWQPLEGAQSWTNNGYLYDYYSSTSSAFPPGLLPLDGYGLGPTAPCPSTSGNPYYVQNTFGHESSNIGLQQNLDGGCFPVAEAESHVNAQNVSFMSDARETALPNVDSAMLGPFNMQGITSHYQSQQEQATDQSAPANDFQFVSGSRPLKPLAAKAALPSIAQEQDQCSGESIIKCKTPGCSSKKNFKRKYELERHMKKHTRTETFECPAVNCKYRGPKAFYRPDKLKAHVIAGHDPETLFACPVAGCFSARKPLPRAMLAVHLRNHYTDSFEPYSGYFKALADCDRFRSCPVEKCLKKLSPCSLQEHILQHTEAERNDHRIKIAAAGFDYLSGCVICPIIGCRITPPDLPAFQDHLIDHIALDANHFRAWKAETMSCSSLCGLDLHQRPWELRYSPLWQFANLSHMIRCPACGEDANPGRVYHFFDLLKDPRDLHAYREQILQLYPGIGWHPIFDDIMPVVHRGTERVP